MQKEELTFENLLAKMQNVSKNRLAKLNSHKN